MIEAAITQAAAESRLIRVLASPKTKQEARYNLFWSSNEARLASFPEDLEAAEITSMPRFRKCYGWLKFSGEVFQSLPVRLRAQPRTVSTIQRSISSSKE